MKISYQQALSAEQQEVVMKGDGHCLVLAGAGAGKTRVLVYRVARLLELGVDPNRILLLTFTNKAAKEMLQRVTQVVERPSQSLWGGTFHAVGNRVLRQWASKLGFAPNYTILDEEDAGALLKNCIAEFSLTAEEKKYLPKGSALKALLSYASNSCESIEHVCEKRLPYLPGTVVGWIFELQKRYQIKKVAQNLLDFDDLLWYWHELLKRFQEARQEQSEQFQYILIDEYQDTNRLQANIVRYLAACHKNLLAVGDDSQSIYSFRAATIANILDFPEQYSGAKVFYLQTNYRSTPQIVDLANASIQHNTQHFPKQLMSSRKNQDRPCLVMVRDFSEQASFVADTILSRRRQGVALGDMAILVRSSYLMIEMELELNRKGIAYVVRGGFRFFEQAHIKDVLAYFRILANFRDENAWMRVLNLFEGIGVATARLIVDKIQRYQNLQEIVALEAVSLSQTTRARQGLSEVLVILRQILSLKAADQLSHGMEIILEAGLRDFLKNYYDNATERIEDIEQLARFTKSYMDLTVFLAEVTLSEEFHNERGKNQRSSFLERVVLSTIHQAKGLEWDTVFLLGLAEGHFPHHKAAENLQDMEEERRLFYVACTRAKAQLFLMYPLVARTFGASGLTMPSTFVSEIDEQYFSLLEVYKKTRQHRLEEPEEDVAVVEYES